MGLHVVVTKGSTTTSQIPIPKELDKTEGAIREKAKRLGLEVVVFSGTFFHNNFSGSLEDLCRCHHAET